MRIADIIRHISNLFEKKRKNPLQLNNDSNLESNLKFLKVGDKSTPIQMSEDTINVEGNLNVNGSAVQTGTDKYTYETKITNFYTTSTSQSYVPISGYVIERTGTSGNNEYVGMVAPYNGTIEKFMFRSEIAQNGTLEFDILESSDGTEAPGTTTGVKDTAINIADDTTVEVTFASMTSGTNALVKGRIYAFRVDTPSAPYDTNVTLVFKWDITS